MAGPACPGPAPKNDRSKQVEVLEIRKTVVNLWKQGWSYGMISHQTGYSVWSVGEIVRGALAELRSNGLEQHRDRTYARLEELYRAMQPMVFRDGFLKEDVSTLLGILDREIRLLGLDAPKRSISVGIPANNETWREVLEALLAILRQENMAATTTAARITSSEITGEAVDPNAVLGIESLPSKATSWTLPGLADEARSQVTSRGKPEPEPVPMSQAEANRRAAEVFSV